MPFFWMSFCDPDKPKGSQFLGACIVEALNVRDAIQVSWECGCNPGGEVKVIEIEKRFEAKVHQEDCYKLFDKRESIAWGHPRVERT